MHIVSFAQHLNGGGVERVLLRLAAGWVARGARVTLLIGDAGGPLASEIAGGVRVVPAGGGGYLALLAKVRRIDGLAPDIVFCPGNHYSALALAARWSTRAPIVAKVSNALVGTHRGVTGRGYARWLRLHPRFVDHLVAMSPAMAGEAAAAMAMPRARISVIPNPSAGSVPGAISPPLPVGRFVLGVGRLAPQKRWDRLIAAFARLGDRDLALVILGEGDERARLTALAARLGLADRVHLPGHAADPLPAMARAAVLALTSDHEGVPGVLGEAIALGTPVVTTDSSVAIAELVRSAAVGTIVGRGDGDALVAALEAWLATEAVRPVPVARDAGDPVGEYLALFDRLVAAR